MSPEQADRADWMWIPGPTSIRWASSSTNCSPEAFRSIRQRPRIPEFLARLTRGELLHPRPSARAAELKGDLDWIILKALERDRDRRYESPRALASDLERYLEGRTVNARPLTRRYRFGKFVRRHRIQVAAACLSIAALTGGAIAAGVGFVRASRAEASARQEAATAQEVSGFLTRLFGAADPKRAPEPRRRCGRCWIVGRKKRRAT